LIIIIVINDVDFQITKVSALILIECTHSSFAKLVSELERNGVDMIYKIAGSPYDVILKLRANSKKDLRKRVTQNETVPTCS
jgi:phosphatidate phosphatase PAH1